MPLETAHVDEVAATLAVSLTTHYIPYSTYQCNKSCMAR